jgi:Raf kinase inhibitor-like YbhB/YbcL family protein
MKRIYVLIFLSVLFCACGERAGAPANGGNSPTAQTGNVQSTPAREPARTQINLTSSAFKDGEAIPKKYACEGENISPPLAWTAAPENAKSFALIVEDPDAPRGTFTHWIIFNLPPNVRELPENVPARAVLDNGAKQGKNDFQKMGYGGACPPSGDKTHRYFFRLYALDATLPLDAKATRAQTQNAIQNHIIAEGQLTGTYKR